MAYKHLTAYKIFIVFIVGFTFYVIGLNVKTLLADVDVFRLKKVYIEGLHVVTSPELIKLSGITRLTSLIFLDKQQIKKNIEKNKRLRLVSLNIKYPDTLQIKVREVPGVFFLKSSNSFLELDKDLNTIAQGNDVLKNGVFVDLDGDKYKKRFTKLIKDFEQVPPDEKDFFNSLSEIVIEKDIVLYPQTPNIKINLGMRSSLEKIRKARYTLVYMKQKGITAKAIDVRFGIVKLKQAMLN